MSVSSKSCPSCSGKLQAKDPHLCCFECLGLHHIPNLCDNCTTLRSLDKSTYNDRLKRLVVWRGLSTDSAPSREAARSQWKQWSESQRFDYSCFLSDPDLAHLKVKVKSKVSKRDSNPPKGGLTPSSADQGQVPPGRPASKAKTATVLVTSSPSGSRKSPQSSSLAGSMPDATSKVAVSSMGLLRTASPAALNVKLQTKATTTLTGSSAGVDAGAGALRGVGAGVGIGAGVLRGVGVDAGAVDAGADAVAGAGILRGAGTGVAAGSEAPTSDRGFIFSLGGGFNIPQLDPQSQMGSYQGLSLTQPSLVVPPAPSVPSSGSAPLLSFGGRFVANQESASAVPLANPASQTSDRQLQDQVSADVSHTVEHGSGSWHSPARSSLLAAGSREGFLPSWGVQPRETDPPGNVPAHTPSGFQLLPPGGRAPAVGAVPSRTPEQSGDSEMDTDQSDSAPPGDASQADLFRELARGVSDVMVARLEDYSTRMDARLAALENRTTVPVTPAVTQVGGPALPVTAPAGSSDQSDAEAFRLVTQHLATLQGVPPVPPQEGFNLYGRTAAVPPRLAVSDTFKRIVVKTALNPESSNKVGVAKSGETWQFQDSHLKMMDRMYVLTPSSADWLGESRRLDPCVAACLELVDASKVSPQTTMRHEASGRCFSEFIAAPHAYPLAQARVKHWGLGVRIANAQHVALSTCAESLASFGASMCSLASQDAALTSQISEAIDHMGSLLKFSQQNCLDFGQLAARGMAGGVDQLRKLVLDHVKIDQNNAKSLRALPLPFPLEGEPPLLFGDQVVSFFQEKQASYDQAKALQSTMQAKATPKPPPPAAPRNQPSGWGRGERERLMDDILARIPAAAMGSSLSKKQRGRKRRAPASTEQTPAKAPKQKFSKKKVGSSKGGQKKTG